MSPRRLPSLPSLSAILPKGAEGGKEFARIVDLLLLRRSNDIGSKLMLFDDAAGDYGGVDALETFGTRTIGYQYKFLPCPLSKGGRAQIRSGLKQAISGKSTTKISTWILITPDDFSNSSKKTGGGDVTWFEKLAAEHAAPFVIEHWGHKHLQDLFLSHPSLSLFYYPDLVPEGMEKRCSLQDLEKKYRAGLRVLYQRIEFVGMSVYKQEATRGIPIEDIYIPLSLVSESRSDLDASRLGPEVLIATGRRTVILGDPGSGKSTLLRFLALAGDSEKLREKYAFPEHDLLPVLIILRRYTEALRREPHLSLLDYIAQSTRSDLNMPEGDGSFFVPFLESGRALLLFDGLDEAVTPNVREQVRNQVRTLCSSYPLNTVVVTSRIVGYSGSVRFPEEEGFQHLVVAPLRTAEISQFLENWYSVRVDNPIEREQNVKDLLLVLNDSQFAAIRELAENPLLLTIITLVYRVDAVLPDERVVLYQKCTETLLNTWQTWKFRDHNLQNRGRIERRNRARLEAIAHWMQGQPSDLKTTISRSIVRSREVENFLVEHIFARERVETKAVARDLAQDFLNFVKERAGLMMEVGDGQFSFLHLTFQEFLTASYLDSVSETGGVDALWNLIQGRLSDSKWYEVIRLTIALKRSEEAQETLVMRVVNRLQEDNEQYRRSILLGGLLVDGIGAAEARRAEIANQIALGLLQAKEKSQVTALLGVIRMLKEKGNGFGEVWSGQILNLYKISRSNQQKCRLVALAAVSAEAQTVTLARFLKKASVYSPEAVLVRFLNVSETPVELVSLSANERRWLSAGLRRLIRTASRSNRIACVLISQFVSIFGADWAFREVVIQALASLAEGVPGPFNDMVFHVSPPGYRPRAARSYATRDGGRAIGLLRSQALLSYLQGLSVAAVEENLLSEHARIEVCATGRSESIDSRSELLVLLEPESTALWNEALGPLSPHRELEAVQKLLHYREASNSEDPLTLAWLFIKEHWYLTNGYSSSEIVTRRIEECGCKHSVVELGRMLVNMIKIGVNDQVVHAEIDSFSRALFVEVLAVG